MNLTQALETLSVKVESVSAKDGSITAMPVTAIGVTCSNKSEIVAVDATNYQQYVMVIVPGKASLLMTLHDFSITYSNVTEWV